VLGSPIAHSLSPAIHRAAYRYLGLSWEYTAHDVNETGLGPFLATLDSQWRGLSVTMPLKRAALELSNDASTIAQTVGAANTLIRADDGRLFADNTDAPGVVAVLTEQAVDITSPVCVWGAGATTASVLVALTSLTSGPIHVHVRSVERARAALAVASAAGRPAQPVSWAVGNGCRQAGVTISTAAAHALDGVAVELAAGITAGQVLFDIVYDPWPTRVAEQWMRRGGAVASGLDLLVHQAVGQLKLMTGEDVPLMVLRTAAEAAIAASP
jgi:shikimate dehydrogenase